jgi:uncharacterized repeat protein (TIGR04076 family)
MKKKITMVEGSCRSGHHKIGDSWIVESVTPEGICLYAWDRIRTYIMHLEMNGEFWGDEPNKFRIHCPDYENGIILEIEKIPD